MTHRSTDRAGARIFDSLSLAASLDTAVRCARSITQRRAGIDPSSQESDPVARGRVRATADQLADIATRLHLHLVLDFGDEHPEAEAIRRFEALMLLRKASEALRVMHQGLLSLYPAVDEDVVEETRRLQGLFSERVAGGSAGTADVDDLQKLLAGVESGQPPG